MDERQPVDANLLFTILAWGVASIVLAFVFYLAWRKFGPNRRHRRHRSRTRYLAGRE
jgi:hypothetical protein